ncbi:Oligopeptide-binding protein AppA [Sulfitobacter indolifex]|uniref:ABC transporter, periplasmic substrate-binding protein, putative n=1 Tax=Sulfitobacter indolifex HEL-45 TaxID=391624 RepID=A0ABM9X4X9_9RHOB|nr:extracellular solute-binding protein [Sulfitobacter indolifex]EDQ04548.1 ABC transporter, periplasmic substrate-binding protein, putative [Sulfitobacter indolifex HEL-45]UOA18641.1 Oligopeptide-binding protein AppA [Sulfitobacter indolifex]
MYGEPDLPSDFSALPYVNADAPKGGAIVLGNTGGFDSLNPFVRKGTAPWQLPHFTHETLMGRSWDEPFALYGLLAETIEVPDDRSWVEFTLREEARFSDGSPVTVEDVIFSFELLGSEGHPRYHGLRQQIDTIEQTGPRSLRMTFNSDNRELALLAGMRPILSKAQWEGQDFANAPLEEFPLGTGPYVISDYQAGRHVTLTRNPDYWGAEVPFRQGTHNYDEVKIDFYGDANVLFEAFKAGQISAVREFNAETWATQYNFPAIARGEVLKSTFPHSKPSGMTGFVMNSRRAPFDDWRVRDALISAFNFEYINETLTGGALPRITSYFSNSDLAMRDGPATGRVFDLLADYADTLPPGTVDGYTLPVADGSVRNRSGIRAAMQQLNAAGYKAEGGMMHRADGTPLTFTILLSKGSRENLAIAELYTQSLKRLGITAQIETVDDAQFVARQNEYDFDMTFFRRSLSLSPGTEQRFYWGSEAADQPGTRNLMGVRSPAVDAMIDQMLQARESADFVAATRALDRILTAGRYVIPFWQFDEGLIAHDARMAYPDEIPLYGDGPNFMPEVWWWKPAETSDQ